MVHGVHNPISTHSPWWAILLRGGRRVSHLIPSPCFGGCPGNDNDAAVVAAAAAAIIMRPSVRPIVLALNLATPPRSAHAPPEVKPEVHPTPEVKAEVTPPGALPLLLRLLHDGDADADAVAPPGGGGAAGDPGVRYPIGDPGAEKGIPGSRDRSKQPPYQSPRGEAEPEEPPPPGPAPPPPAAPPPPPPGASRGGGGADLVLNSFQKLLLSPGGFSSLKTLYPSQEDTKWIWAAMVVVLLWKPRCDVYDVITSRVTFTS